jgi:transposase InsO family protein
VVGWAFADHMRTELPRRALQRALDARHPAPGLIHHSDRGSQYASREYRNVLVEHQVACSMSRAGDCFMRRLRDDIAPKVAADVAYQNAKANTLQTARIEHDKALDRVMLGLLKDDTEVYKQFVQNPLFKRFVTDFVFTMTSETKRPPSSPP